MVPSVVPAVGIQAVVVSALSDSLACLEQRHNMAAGIGEALGTVSHTLVAQQLVTGQDMNQA